MSNSVQLKFLHLHVCRPISLLNSDYKLLTKIILNRLQEFLPTLLILSHSTREICEEIMATVAASQNKYPPQMLLSLDAEKALTWSPGNFFVQYSDIAILVTPFFTFFILYKHRSPRQRFSGLVQTHTLFR